MKSNSTNRGNAAIGLILVIALIAGGVAGFVQYRTTQSVTQNTQRLEQADRQMQDLVARLDVAYQAVAQIKRQQDESLGATNKIPDLRALYEDSLASKITSSATSFTLTRGTSNGTALASSTYPFIIDEGTSNEEFVLADCTGTTCTNVTRGLSLTTGTTTVASLQKAHGRGASVKITDGPILLILNRILQGVDTFPNTLYYQSLSTSTQASLSDRKFIPTGEYVDFVGSSGCSNASATTRGCIELATQIEAASSTSAGGTGANLVIPASMATSSPGTAGLWAVITNNAGKIAQSFLDLTITYAWTALNTFSGGLTSTATTTLAGSNVNSNAVVINTIPYAFPGSQGSANQVLTNNGSGTLSWANAALAHYSLANLSADPGGGATATTSVLSIPSGVLTASSTVRWSGYGNVNYNGGGCDAQLRKSTGQLLASAGVSPVGSNGTVTDFSFNGMMNFVTGTASEAYTTTQASIVQGNVSASDPGNTGGSTGTASVDLSGAVGFAISLVCSGSGDGVLSGASIEVIP